MGFLKRFLSLGSSKSKKNKKKQAASHAKEVDAEGRILPQTARDQDPDTSVNRLLRSSSTKFSVMSEIDYTSLPPPPALPIGDAPSTPSLSPSPSMLTVATTPGLQRSGTYVVKLHGRTTHSRTEFPRANPPPSPTKTSRRTEPKTPHQDRHDNHNDDNDDEPRGPRLKEVNFTPKDNSRIYALRQDPSVVSLLNMYDDRGCLDVHAFASTPPTPAPICTEFEGRQARPRTGSTLRQLLGEPQPAFMTKTYTTEGDISWAERFLDEQLNDGSALSSPASEALETPKDALFPDNLSAPPVGVADVTLSSLDADADSSINYPAISSMEVEVSGTEENVPMQVEAAPKPKPVTHTGIEPKTPQRASEVFGFLNRRNTVTVKERDLPELPPELSPQHTGASLDGANDAEPKPCTITNDAPPDATHSHTVSPDTSHSASNTSSDTPSNFSHAQIQTATMTKLSSAFASSTLSLNLLVPSDDQAERAISPVPHTVPSSDTHDNISSSDMAVPLQPTGTSSHTSTYTACHHHTGSSLSTNSSMKLPPSKIPRGPRPRPTKEPADFATHPARAQNKWHQAAEEPAPVSSSSHRSASRAAKREAFTNIPQRQHRRVTSRSSELASDEDQNAVTLPKTPGASTSHARKRSIKPELLAQTFGKENTPSPPRRSSPNTSPARGGYIMQTQSQIQTPSRPRTFAGHLLLERDGMQVPPSPASSSELSPVAQDMMNNLRKQRMRARQVERRKGIWVRE